MFSDPDYLICLVYKLNIRKSKPSVFFPPATVTSWRKGGDWCTQASVAYWEKPSTLHNDAAAAEAHHSFFSHLSLLLHHPSPSTCFFPLPPPFPLGTPSPCVRVRVELWQVKSDLTSQQITHTCKHFMPVFPLALGDFFFFPQVECWQLTVSEAGGLSNMLRNNNHTYIVEKSFTGQPCSQSSHK